MTIHLHQSLFFKIIPFNYFSINLVASRVEKLLRSQKVMIIYTKLLFHGDHFPAMVSINWCWLQVSLFSLIKVILKLATLLTLRDKRITGSYYILSIKDVHKCNVPVLQLPSLLKWLKDLLDKKLCMIRVYSRPLLGVAIASNIVTRVLKKIVQNG